MTNDPGYDYEEHCRSQDANARCVERCCQGGPIGNWCAGCPGDIDESGSALTAAKEGGR